MITKSELPRELVTSVELASFTNAINGTITAAAPVQTSAAITVPANKAVIVSFEAPAAAQFVTEASNSNWAGVTTLHSEYFTGGASRIVHAYLPGPEAWQLRFTVINQNCNSLAQRSDLPGVRVAYQHRG